MVQACTIPDSFNQVGGAQRAATIAKGKSKMTTTAAIAIATATHDNARDLHDDLDPEQVTRPTMYLPTWCNLTFDDEGCEDDQCTVCGA